MTALLQCVGFSLWCLLFLQSTGCRHWELPVVAACRLQDVWALVVAAHVGSQLQDSRSMKPVSSCIGRWILMHCTYHQGSPAVFIVISFSFHEM